MFSEWKVKIVDVGYSFARDVYIFRETHEGTEFLQADGNIKLTNTTLETPQPTIRLDPEALQTLADELGRVGYKPQKGFVEGKLEATEKHLDDMRKIVFEPVVSGKQTTE